jgi:hypothetical protein
MLVSGDDALPDGRATAPVLLQRAGNPSSWTTPIAIRMFGDGKDYLLPLLLFSASRTSIAKRWITAS